MIKSFILFFSCCLFLSGSAHGVEKVIFDTDMGGDIDDAGALAMLHNLADAGEIEFLAVCAVNGNMKTVPFIDAVNTFFGRPDLPVGTVKGDGPYLDRNNYLNYVTANYPHNLTKSSAPEAVSLYRQILAAQPDNSVTIVVVGQCTNISDLLDSGADQYSSLNGVELMRKKVKFYGAGGNGDANLPSGRCGHNYRTDLTSANNELAKLPTDFSTVFAGGSGKYIKVGDELKDLPADDIIYRAYYEYFDGGNLDRPTWDQCRVLYAARPSVRSMFDNSAGGTISLSGETITWSGSTNRNRSYAYAKSNAAVETILSELMLRRDSSPAGGATDLITPSTFADQSAGWSTETGRTVDRAHDGSTTTEAWAEVNDTVWLEYRFDGDYALTDARVYDDNDGGHQIGTWKVMCHDGSGWEDACAWQSAGAVGWSSASVAGVTTDRVRVLCLAPAGALVELREFECTGEPDTATGSGTDTTVNNGTDDLITAATFADQSSGWSTESGRTVDRAHDGSSATEAWGTTSDPLWLEYRFDGQYDLESARVYDDNGGNYEIGQWKVMYHDGAAWQDAFAYKSSGSEGWSTASMAGITTDRVRVYCQAPSGLSLELREFECTGMLAATSGVRTTVPLQAVAAPGNGYRISTGTVDPGFSLRIMDQAGRCIHDLTGQVRTSGYADWQLRGVAPGIYLVSLQARRTWVRKLVVTE